MAKRADQMVILGDVCNGLLARMYNLTHFKKPSTLNQDVEKVCKLLVKRFPDHPAELERAAGYEVFAKRAANICSELQDYYLTFIDAMQCHDATWKLLLDVSKSIVEFKFNLNPDLMTSFLNLFVAYLRLHMLVSRVEDAKLLLSAYARAYHHTHGNTEPNFLRIASYVGDAGDDVILSLRDRCSDITLCIGETLRSFLPVVGKWNDIQMLLGQRLFNVLDKEKEMAKPHKESEFRELLYLDKFHEWVLWGFLMCPAELQPDGALELLQMCLKNTFVLPVYRNELLDIDQEYDKLFDSYRHNKFRLSKHKKILKETYKGTSTIVANHFKLRAYLRIEMTSLLQLFTEFPGLLGPKIQMVWTILRLARNEVDWYIRHLHVKPHKAKDWVKPDQYEDTRVSELIGLVYEISELVRKHQGIIQRYSIKYLRVHDSQKLLPVANRFTKTSQLSTAIASLINEITSGLSSASVNDDFEAIRLNWYRVSAALNDQQSGILGKTSGELTSVMSNVIIHSRNIDKIESQLRQHASFHNLFWYRNELGDIMNKCLNGALGQPRHCVSLVAILNQAMACVHRYCPEEQKLIGEHSVSTAEKFISAIVGVVRHGVQQVLDRTFKLQLPVLPSHALADGPMPGAESLYERRRGVRDLRLVKKRLSEICESIRTNETIIVYDTEFAPREFLYEMMAKQFQFMVRHLAVPKQAAQRPSVLLNQIKSLISAYSIVDNHVNINLHDIVRDTFFNEFVDVTTGGVGQPLMDDSNERKDSSSASKKANIVTVLAQWYNRKFFSQDMSKLRINYSALRRGFVTIPSRNDSNSSGAAAEYYADMSELKALCTLIGPYGVRVFDRLLLSSIRRRFGTIKGILENNSKTLGIMHNRFTEQQFWASHVRNLKDLGPLTSAAILVGCQLNFRKLLRQALREVIADGVPFVYQTVQNMYDQYPHNTHMDKKLVELDLLAHDCGVDVAGADHSLKLALSDLKKSQQDQQLWNLLPELFGSMFTCDQWQHSQYIIETESFIRNEHCIAVTVSSLITIFRSLSVDAQQLDSRVELAIQADMERFLRCASSTMLHMMNDRGTYGSLNRSSVIVFIEQFMLSTDRLQASILEDFFPFSLIRTNYIQLSERQTAKGRMYAVQGDDEEESGNNNNNNNNSKCSRRSLRLWRHQPMPRPALALTTMTVLRSRCNWCPIN
eukprot:TRINITY_DN66191_c5_g3_i2.p1 TRINITY_DN66191_c5_g3~~TRINITY_DN66191_c5_g3_i2.p1  ORF type:complete len:1186 (+),score=697.15 TRINITY_DN66191_c5_g3_i2:131-3688(+)